MTSIAVADASALVGVLVGKDSRAAWAARALADLELAAPAQAPFEVANVLRRHELAGLTTRPTASQAHDELRLLRVAL